jgi:uncharacterized protein (TIGR02001 family)
MTSLTKSLRSLSLLSLLGLSLLLAPNVAAQSFSLGADVVSRYVWRGVDFGESAAIQPALEFSAEGFAIGAWGSYALDDAAANENDLYISYSIDTGSGSVAFGVTDYFFPTSGTDFFDFEVDGQHVIEPFISYDGPVSLLLAINAMNDPDNSIYAEVGVPFEVENVALGLTAGASLGESVWYGTDGLGIINLGIGAATPLPITDTFALPLFVQYILNPYAAQNYLVFGLSISP